MREWRLAKKGDGANWWIEWLDDRGQWHSCATDTSSADRAADLAANITRPDSLHLPTHAQPQEAPSRTLEDCLVDFLDAARLDKARQTVASYRLMAGHLARLCGGFRLSRLHVDQVQAYIVARLDEGAARETVRKELVCLRQALKNAKRRGELRGIDLSDLFPPFSAPYQPRDRYLTPEQAVSLLQRLPDHRQRWVLVAAWAGLRLSEVERLQWVDVDFDQALLRVRGSKTPGSYRLVGLAPALADFLRPVRAVRGFVVTRWHNVRRDLELACRDAGLPRVTPNDLRRTFASWLVQAGKSNFVVARLLGHRSTKMVDLVYGHLDRATIADAVADLPQLPVCSTVEQTSARSSWFTDPDNRRV